MTENTETATETTTTKTKGNKKAFDFARSALYVADPIKDLVLIGGQNPDFKMPEEEWGDFDTEDGDTHVLFDERLGLPLSPEFIANVNAYGVLQPIIIAKIDDQACVVDGRQRVRAARVVNRMRKLKGEPPLSVRCEIRRSNDVGLLGAMVAPNHFRVDEAADSAIAKLKRMMDRGVSLPDAAITFGKSETTLQGWLDYDDNSIPAVKKAVESGRLSQTAASHIAKLKDPEKQKAALSEVLSSPIGTKISRRTVKIAAKRTVSPEKEEGIGDRRTQKKLLVTVQATPHPNASEKTLAFWQGAEDMLKLILGHDDADKRLVELLAKLRAEAK